MDHDELDHSGQALQERFEAILQLLDDERTEEALADLDALILEINDAPRLHALRASILRQLRRLDEARRAAELAHALDDEDFVPLLTLAEIELEASEPRAAIDWARKGLALEPAAHGLILVEAHAHAMLGRWDEVVPRVEYVLANDPQDPYAAFLRIAAVESKNGGKGMLDAAEWASLAERFPHIAHARRGNAWALLQRGRGRRAEAEFRDALALDPSDPLAREGLVLALKTRYPGYTLLLRFFFWIQTLPPNTQLGVLIGGVFGVRVLRTIAKSNPALQPLIYTVIAAYALLMLATWLADPLLNLTLLARAEGRRLLSPDDRRGAIAVGMVLFTGIAIALVGFATNSGALLLGGAAVGLPALTVAGGFQCAPGKHRNALLVAAGVFVTFGLASLALPEQPAAMLATLSFLGTAISTWVSRPLIRRSHQAYND